MYPRPSELANVQLKYELSYSLYCYNALLRKRRLDDEF